MTAQSLGFSVHHVFKNLAIHFKRVDAQQILAPIHFGCVLVLQPSHRSSTCQLALSLSHACALRLRAKTPIDARLGRPALSMQTLTLAGRMFERSQMPAIELLGIR